ncbi:hypothetical protein M407DRAFT_24951 [Tulasnella calospora MUT 4182]|uniref:Uncharacterized protein n=1 Tax=Tulasnella calospora MUT 4182 TaxID=1051891 RepID=A0A0C3KW45_9AGAM|nr:hypothetical protein M407DRAFT_24951 [Tulasnella calospora MUT 4182]
MEGDANTAAAVVGVITLVVLAVLFWLLGLFQSFTPQSLTAWHRSFGVSFVPSVSSPQSHLAPNGGNDLPPSRHHPHHPGASPSVTSLANPPSAYSSHAAVRQYNSPFGIFGNRRGISVAVVPPPLPPSDTVSPDEDEQSI